ncbi:MAG: hypothetical protein ACRET4_13030 [Steroidobacteraceae bacterium]
MRPTTRAALTALALITACACMPSRSSEPKAEPAPSAGAQSAAKPMTEEERKREIDKRTAVRGDRAQMPAAVNAGGKEGEPPPVVGEVPDAILAPMKADLAERVGAAAGRARIVRAEQVIWPDGSIGCAKPGVMYTQALVPGYLVEFEVDGKSYRYHSTLKGGATYCERPGVHMPVNGPAQ